MSEDGDNKGGDLAFMAALIHVDWGFMEEGIFIVLPKLPMVQAGHKMPPFDITLPSGEVRHIIERIKE